MTLSLATRLVNKEKRFLGGNPSFVCLFGCLFDFICFRMNVLFFLLLIHAYNLIVKMLYFVFIFVLITYKGILQKLSVREIQICL